MKIMLKFSLSKTYKNFNNKSSLKYSLDKKVLK